MYKEFEFNNMRKNGLGETGDKYWLGVIYSDKDRNSEEFKKELTEGYLAFNEAHGIDRKRAGGRAKFTFHRNNDNEHICSVCCAGAMCEDFVDFGLQYIEAMLGAVPTLSDLKRILKEANQND